MKETPSDALEEPSRDRQSATSRRPALRGPGNAVKQTAAPSILDLQVQLLGVLDHLRVQQSRSRHSRLQLLIASQSMP